VRQQRQSGKTPERQRNQSSAARQRDGATERRENQNSKGTATADYGQQEAATSSSIASETSRKVQKRAEKCTSFLDEQEHLNGRAAEQSRRSRKSGAEDGE
jgi:hypothetical protein